MILLFVLFFIFILIHYILDNKLFSTLTKLNNGNINNEMIMNEQDIHRTEGYAENEQLRSKQKQNTLMVKQWLMNTVGMMEYEIISKLFIENGYQSMAFIMEIVHKGELEEIGIESEQHQIKLMEEIRKLKAENVGNAINEIAKTVYIMNEENDDIVVGDDETEFGTMK